MKYTTPLPFVTFFFNRCAALLVLFLLVSCGPAPITLTEATATAPQPPVTFPAATATLPQAIAPLSQASATLQESSLTISQAAATWEAATAAAPQVTPVPLSLLYPLSDPGPYAVGVRGFDFEDAGREGRHVGVGIWYPALPDEDAIDTRAIEDAEPDTRGAPYPLVISSSKTAGTFGTHLASHGFVVAGVRGQDAKSSWGDWLIDYPRDILFALEQIASTPLDGLAELIDSDHVGVMGYSFDGYNSLATSGARIDPQFYLDKCAGARPVDPAPEAWWITYICRPANEWDKFVANAGDVIPSVDGGLWQPMTDDRIRAVMPMAPEGAWLFGERGLATVDRPVLIIGATEDSGNDYNLEAVYIYEHLGTPDRLMISFVGEGHMMIYDGETINRLQHFATAFFGYHLQAREELAEYFSEEFVAGHNELAWGVFIEE